MASTLGSTFWNKEVEIGFPPMTSPPPQVNFNEGLSLKISSNICEWMEVKISSHVKFFKLYPRGREANNRGNVGAFRFVIS